MRAGASAARQRKSNSQGARACPSKGTDVHQILPFELFLRTIWPHDHAKNYMRLTGAKLRTAKYRLAGRDPDFAEVIAILRSEHGYQFLQHVMGDAHPKWWRGIQHARSLGALRREVAEHNKRIAQLELAID